MLPQVVVRRTVEPALSARPRALLEHVLSLAWCVWGYAPRKGATGSRYQLEAATLYHYEGASDFTCSETGCVEKSTHPESGAPRYDDARSAR